MKLTDEIINFLESKGFGCSRHLNDGTDIICTRTHKQHKTRVILPLEVIAASTMEASVFSDMVIDHIRSVSSEGAPIVITEDRWRSQTEMTQARLLAHLEVFNQAFARNCEVRRIEKSQAREFLQTNHSYGYAACRYHYGMFLKRQTGHLASSGADLLSPGTLIAVATFSNARKWTKGDKEIRSYEWTRYASLPGLRINGGMGKILKTFISEVKPDDIMSYADLEWSEGEVYRQLGFSLEGQKEPVTFAIDTCTWARTPVRPGMTSGSTEEAIVGITGNLYFRNFGSNKYRLKLTDYE